MPDSRRGWSDKREKEYEELEEEFEEQGRYKGREDEVAARIVNKQRSEQSETKGQRAEDKRGESPDRNLPIDNYDNLTADQITSKLDKLSDSQIKQIESYERKHENRKTLLQTLERRRGD